MKLIVRLLLLFAVFTIVTSFQKLHKMTARLKYNDAINNRIYSNSNMYAMKSNHITYYNSNLITNSNQAPEPFLQYIRNDIRYKYNNVKVRVQEMKLPAFLTIAVQVICYTLIGVAPSHAAPASSAELRAILNSRRQGNSKPNLLQKIFLGANARGTFKQWKAGDTRAELTMILNGLTMGLILFVWGFIAYLFQKKQEFTELRNMRREVIREKEYRENMYFEAVETILEKLNDPKLKGAAKANLNRQLKDIDPDGKIRDFLEGKTERPDLTKEIEDGRKSRQQKDKEMRRKQQRMEKKKAAKRSNKTKGVEDEEGDPSLTEDTDNSTAASSNNNNDSNDVANDDAYMQVLRELDGSLVDSLVPAKRKQLINYLKDRIESITNSSKQEEIVLKIVKKLGDEDYWINYASKL